MIEKKNTVGKSSDDFIRIQDLWGMFVPRWHWFAASLFVTFTVAVLYLLSTPPVYTRTASILVKDDSKSGSATDAMNGFADLGLFKSNTNINNELLTLASPTLMTEVVHRLKLNETFTVRKGLKQVELYKSAPVAVTIDGGADQPVEFTIELTAKDSFSISDFVVFDEETDETFSGKMGDSIRTSAGIVVLTPTPLLTEDFIGTSLRYGRGNIQAVTDYYTDRLRAELGSEDATIINLSISDPSIRKAEEILGTLIEVYNEKWIEDKNQIAVSASQFISGRLGVIENELGHVDENIAGYKSEHLLPDVQAASNLYMMQAAENKKELLALTDRLSIARYIRHELESQPLSQPLSGNSGIDNSSIEGQIEEYNAKVLERNRLIANSSEKNPLVKDLTNSLQSIRKTILQSVDNLIVSLNTNLQSIRSQEAATTGRLASNPNQAKYLLSVERQQKVKEELYLYLLQKREENQLSQAFTAYNTRVITAPRGSLFPTAPRKVNILLVAFAVGLLFPAVVIFTRENMNTKVRGRKDLGNMSAPFIGEIPQVEQGRRKRIQRRKGKTEEYAVVVKPGKRDIMNEAFRVVRTNLEFMAGQDKNNKVVMLTSFNPGSGKTFICMNLATSLAIKDKRVVIVDLDLRRASLSTYVQAPGTGIVNYLAGQVENWQSIVTKGDGGVLPDVIPVGTIPPNPTELLFNPRLEGLITGLRGQYDYVFIDCPPVEIVADTSIIAKWADLTLFVVRAGLMEREMLPVADSFYAEHKFTNIAILLNGTTAAHNRYGYYRYGYHYGYGNYSSGA